MSDKKAIYMLNDIKNHTGCMTSKETVKNLIFDKHKNLKRK
jgi:hypothetical protein